MLLKTDMVIKRRQKQWACRPSAAGHEGCRSRQPGGQATYARLPLMLRKAASALAHHHTDLLHQRLAENARRVFLSFPQTQPMLEPTGDTGTLVRQRFCAQAINQSPAEY